jgi:hypothetical protein
MVCRVHLHARIAGVHLAASGDSAFLPAFICRGCVLPAPRFSRGCARLLQLQRFWRSHYSGVPVIPIALLAIGGLAVATAVVARDWRRWRSRSSSGPTLRRTLRPSCPAAEFVASDRFPRTDRHRSSDRMTGDMVWRAYTDSSLGVDARLSGATAQVGGIRQHIQILRRSRDRRESLVAVRGANDARTSARGCNRRAGVVSILSAGEFHPFSPPSGLPAVTSLGGWNRCDRRRAVRRGTAASMPDRWLTTPRRQYARPPVLRSASSAWCSSTSGRSRTHFACPLAAGFRVPERSRTHTHVYRAAAVDSRR